jgi:2-oxoisovalerate ferredoxin oxidoreductase alpha subunit
MKRRTIFRNWGVPLYRQNQKEAAINMVYGAAAAATGHDLIFRSGHESDAGGISYLAGSELPAVVFVFMRAGPCLGNIGPEQGDYNQVVKGGGHGNYRNIVLAPSSVQEMCDYTMRAFELADRYRNPAVVLCDGVLGQMIETMSFPGNAVTPQKDYSRVTDGTARTRGNLVTSIFLDFNLLEDFNNRLQQKYATISEQSRQRKLPHRRCQTRTGGLCISTVSVAAQLMKPGPKA